MKDIMTETSAIQADRTAITKEDLKFLDEFDIKLKKMPKTQRKGAVKEEVTRLWEVVGWHRPLAGFWYNFVLLLIIAVPAIMSFTMISLVLPYSEAIGFANTTMAFLLPLYNLADFGIKNAVERFIAQYASTNTRKALSYMSFYIYYQLITGLVQVTGVSLFAVYVLPQTSMSYAGWFFLVYIMIQWPGTPGIFLSGLGGFQQFDKQNVLVVIQNVAIQTLTQLGFILIGRYLGSLDPTVGELMGAVMGFILGSYFDDIITLFIGAKLFSKVLQPYGLQLREVFYISFDKQIAKQVLIYGGKVMPSGFSYYAVSALIAWMLANWFSAYPTYVGLYSIASGVIGALGVSFSSSSPISQSYNNGKHNLALFYIRSQFQWWGILSVGILMAPLLFLIPPIIGNVAGEYAEVQWMIWPLFLGAFILFPTNFAGVICEACNLPQKSTFMNFIEQGTRFIVYFIALSPWTVSAWFGEEYVIVAWLFSEAPGYALKGVYGWRVVKKNLFPGKKIGFPLYQTFIAPAVGMLLFIPIYLIMLAIFRNVWLADETMGYVLAGIYLLSVLFVFPIFIFMPLYGFLGAWDLKSLDDFRKCALMAGPSRFLVTKLYQGAKFGFTHSPLKGRFKIPYEVPMEEADQLMEIYKENLKILKETQK
jgi:hypothetical protein